MKIITTLFRSHLLSLAGLLALVISPAVSAAAVPLAKTLTPATATGSESGAAVAMNDLYILVGAPAADSGNGAVDVYNAVTRSLVRRIVGTSLGRFGSAVAIAGNTAYIGAPEQSTVVYQGGAVWAYDIPTGKRLWVSEGDQKYMSLGEVLAVAGEYVAVGLPSKPGPKNPDTFSGHVRLLDRKSGQYRAALESPNPNHGDKCGIALAGSGNMLAIGIPFYDSVVMDQSLVMLVDVSKPGFTYQNFAGGPSLSEYGSRLALNDSYLAVATKTGVRLHSLVTGYTAIKVIGSALADWNVVISGERVIASNSLNGGQIVIYDVAHDNEPFTIPAPAPTLPSSKFGRAMAISQGTLVIGDGVVPNSYVYDLPAISWASAKVNKFLKTGETVLGVPGALFSKIGAVSMTAAGKVSAVAELKGSGITAANKLGVWSNITGSADLVVRSGDAWGLLKLGSVGPTMVNATTRGLVMARFAGSNARVILEDQGAAVVEIAREGGIINGGKKLLKLHEVVQPSLSGAADRACAVGAYQVGVAGVTTGTDSAVFGTGGIGSFVELAREGNTSPANNTFYGQIMPRISRPGAYAAFCTTLTGSGATTADNMAVVRYNVSMSTSMVVARKGNNASGVLVGNFSTFLAESACAAGNVVFRATMSGVPSSSNEGIWTTNADGLSPTLVARKGGPAVGLPIGVVFSRFLRVHQAANGDLAILALVKGPGVTTSNDQCLWTYQENDGLIAIAREGDMAPGAGGARYGAFQNFEMAASEQFMLTSTLTQCASSTNMALFTGRSSYNRPISERLPRIQLRKGSQFVRPTGSPSLQSMSFTRTADSAGFTGKGLGSVIESGPCAFILQFADGTADLMTGNL